MRRSFIDYFLAVLFSLLGLMFFTQVIAHFIVKNSDPPLLLVVHTLIGIFAILSAIGVWQQLRYAMKTVLIWGVMLAGNIIILIPFFPPQDRGGLWAIAVIIQGFTVVVLCYLRRRLKHAFIKVAE